MFDTNVQHVSVILLSLLNHILPIISQIDETKCSEEFYVLGLSKLRSFHLLCVSV
jgi:hypothetical protein